MADQSVKALVMGKFSQFVPRMYRRIQALRLKAVKDLGISRLQMEIITALAEQDGLTVTDLAQRLFVAKPNVTTALDDLVQRHFAEKTAHPTDQRSQLVRLLPLGQGVREEIRARFQALVEDAFSGITDQDLGALSTGLDILNSMVEKLGSES